MNSLVSDHMFQPLATGRERKSGRAARDERGDAVWEWQIETGVFERFVTDEQLRRLEAPDLQIVESPPPRQYEGLWVHDSHRPVSRSRQAATDASTARSMRAGLNPLRLLWARIRGQ